MYINVESKTFNLITDKNLNVGNFFNQTSMEGLKAVTDIQRWVLGVCYRGNCECYRTFSSSKKFPTLK